MNILKINSYSKIESIFLCLALTILAVFILNVGSLFMILLPIANGNKLQLIGAGVSMILGFILIPVLVLKSLIGFNYSILN
ncbi:CPBP family intramembrane metalloprotease, partial [Staphylococcus succinus subsp. succinus]